MSSFLNGKFQEVFLEWMVKGASRASASTHLAATPVLSPNPFETKACQWVVWPYATCNMRNRILTVSQLGPCGNGVPFRNPLWRLRLLANFTLATSSPFSAPGGRAHKRHWAWSVPFLKVISSHFPPPSPFCASGPKASVSCRWPFGLSNWHSWCLFSFRKWHLAWAALCKIGHVNCKSNSHMQYALKQTLTTWSSLWFKVSKGPSPPAHFVLIPLWSQFSCCGKIGSFALGTTVMAQIKGGGLPRVMTSVFNHPSFQNFAVRTCYLQPESFDCFASNYVKIQPPGTAWLHTDLMAFTEEWESGPGLFTLAAGSQKVIQYLETIHLFVWRPMAISSIKGWCKDQRRANKFQIHLHNNIRCYVLIVVITLKWISWILAAWSNSKDSAETTTSLLWHPQSVQKGIWVHLGCYSKNIIHWVIYTASIYFSQFWRLKSSRSRYKQVQCLVRMVSGASWFVGSHLLLVPSHGKGEGALWDLFYKNTDPIHGSSTLMT